MILEQIQIPEYLKDCVQSFWILEDGISNPLQKEFQTIADGCPGLIFQHTGKGIFYQDHKQLPPAFLYGQATKPNTIQVAGQFSTIGIFFYPHALKTVFGLQANELTNTCIDLSLLPATQGFRLLEKLLDSASTDNQITTLSAFVFSQMKKNLYQHDKQIHYALSKIIAANGKIALKGLAKSLNVSERKFERYFKECIGIPPVLFCRIVRFQMSLKQLHHKEYTRLSDIAYDNDYADQSHFIRSFKEFAGVTPYQYKSKPQGVVENFFDLSK